MTRARLRDRFRPAVEALEGRLTPAVSFAGQQTFTVGTNPASMAVADFNLDGRPDLAVVNSSSNTVSVLLNATLPESGLAAFSGQQTFAVGGSPFGVVVGDFNGDGKPDLAVANFNDNTVSVLLNTSPGGAGSTLSFAPQRTFAVGTNPQALAVGDFLGNGKMDLAVANLGSNTVSVLLNATATGSMTASFAAQQTFAVGNHPIFVATGDFNGDGKQDLAVSNFDSNNLSVLLNTTPTGATTTAFAGQQTFAVGTNPIPLAVGDFNGDGKADLAVANAGTTAAPGNTVSVLLNTTTTGSGTASFAAQQTFAVGSNPQGLAVADFDGDGKPDLAVGNFNDNTVSVLLNSTTTGSATAAFAAQQTFAVGTNPVPLAVGDLNGDGQADLAVSNNANRTVSILLNTTTALPAAPVVVGQFGTAGVWEYHRAQGAWTQLTAANAALLVDDSQGDVVGEFHGYGVWEFTNATGWKQLNGVDASVLAMNAGGTVVAEFPGYGVGRFVPGSGWSTLTAANATMLAVDTAGNVTGEFPGFGLWKFTGAAGWKQINVTDVVALAMDPQGDVVADFRGYGIWELHPTGGWTLLNGTDATTLATDAQGDVFAAFGGNIGLGELFAAGGGRILTAANATRFGGGADGEVFGDFAGYGVWAFDPHWGWIKLTPVDAGPLVVS
jgi:hypothetical protein